MALNVALSFTHAIAFHWYDGELRPRNGKILHGDLGWTILFIIGGSLFLMLIIFCLGTMFGYKNILVLETIILLLHMTAFHFHEKMSARQPPPISKPTNPWNQPNKGIKKASRQKTIVTQTGLYHGTPTVPGAFDIYYTNTWYAKKYSERPSGVYYTTDFTYAKSKAEPGGLIVEIEVDQGCSPIQVYEGIYVVEIKDVEPEQMYFMAGITPKAVLDLQGNIITRKEAA